MSDLAIPPPISQPTSLVIPEAKKSSCCKPCCLVTLCKKVYSVYEKIVVKLVRYLLKHNWHKTGMALSSILLEPFACIRHLYYSALGCCNKKMRYYGLNPKNITDIQATKRAIILIHGNYSNHTVWRSLAKNKAFRQLGPAFTVNLPNGRVTKKDYALLDKKIDEIKALYAANGVDDVVIDLVGYSRGAGIASRAGLLCLGNSTDDSRHSKNIGKVVTIATPLRESSYKWCDQYKEGFHERIFEIIGNKDFLVTEKSLCKDGNQATVNSGHCGIAFSLSTHKLVVDWLSKDNELVK